MFGYGKFQINNNISEIMKQLSSHLIFFRFKVYLKIAIIKHFREEGRWFCGSCPERFPNYLCKWRWGRPRQLHWGYTLPWVVLRGTFCGWPCYRWLPLICWECTVQFRTVFQVAQSLMLFQLKNLIQLGNLFNIIITPTIFVMLSD